MASSKLIRITKAIVKRDKEVFDALIDFEKTGKIRTKTRLNFTIDKGIARRFRSYCRDHGYNMSAKIEEMIRNSLNDR